MQKDLVEDSYWNNQRDIDPNINILSLGLIEYKNAIQKPNELIKSIEFLDEKIKNNKARTALKQWEKWNYSHDKDSKITFCLAKYIPLTSEINVKDMFYEDQTFISQQLHDSVDNGISKYYDVYPRAEKEINSKERFTRLLKYTGGGFMPTHSDHSTSTRTISTILYLNDDYNGGELYFPYPDILIKPSAGSLIIFPSNFIYAHEVKSIKSGIRYSFPNWFHNSKKQSLSDIDPEKIKQSYE